VTADQLKRPSYRELYALAVDLAVVTYGTVPDSALDALSERAEDLTNAHVLIGAQRGEHPLPTSEREEQ
jgi:tryptophan synthase beta subunit